MMPGKHEQEAIKHSTLQLISRAFSVWLLLMSFEFMHALWRTKFLALWIGDYPARQACILTGSVFILFLVYVCIPWIPVTGARALLGVGLGWLALTLIFETWLEHFVLRRPWQDLASDFNLWHGGMLPIGLAVLTLSPLLGARWRSHMIASAYSGRS